MVQIFFDSSELRNGKCALTYNSAELKFLLSEYLPESLPKMKSQAYLGLKKN